MSFWLLIQYIVVLAVVHYFFGLTGVVILFGLIMVVALVQLEARLEQIAKKLGLPGKEG